MSVTVEEQQRMMQKAKEIATAAHQGIFRKNGRDPYINHLIRVAESFPEQSFILRVIGYLHDVVEDSQVTLAEIAREFSAPNFSGVNTHVIIAAIDALTRRSGENYLDFILRVKEDKIATAVKLADLADNMSDLKEGSLLDKYRMASYILSH